MFKRILIPLDGSEVAERSLDPAQRIARAYGSEVFLLRAPELETMFIPAPDAFGGYGLQWPDQALERSREESADYLEEMAGQNALHELNLQRLLVEGDPAAVIVDTAAHEEVDLIVMSTHGYSGITRWVLGSVTEKVLRSATCPVLVIRGEPALEKALLTLDGSEHAERALLAGLSVAAALGAQVTLLRAIAPIPERSAIFDQLESLERGLGTRMQHEAQAEAEAYLDRLVVRERRPGLTLRAAVTREPAAPSILEYAGIYGIDLIMMATHGRTGMQRWVYGSVTEKVLRDGSCSMLIVPTR